MLKFEADDKIFKLVIKVHRFNYQDIVTASGVFDGHILNLRFVGDYEQVYRIMTATAEKMPAESRSAEPTLTESDPAKAEIEAIEEAVK